MSSSPNKSQKRVGVIRTWIEDFILALWNYSRNPKVLRVTIVGRPRAICEPYASLAVPDPFARQVCLYMFRLSHNHRVVTTLTYTSDVIPIAFRVDVTVDRLESSFHYSGPKHPGASGRPTRCRRLSVLRYVYRSPTIT